MNMHVCRSIRVDIRGKVVEISSFFPPHGFCRSNSGRQSRWPAILLDEHLTGPKYGHCLKFRDKVRIVLSVSISGSLTNTVFITE